MSHRSSFYLAILAILVIGAIFVWNNQDDAPLSSADLSTLSGSDQLTPEPTESPSPSVLASVSPATNSPVSAATISPEKLFYPMTRYTTRITNRSYAQKITPEDSKPLACGDPFEGLHTGDDLEVSSSELEGDSPVYAIADGTVLDVAEVSGYGGLIVTQHTINGQTYTAYYGHISTAKTTIKAKDAVTAGQRITVLGANCSAETSNERKHLHFALHKGSEVDVKGYASAAEISEWVNPKELLAQLGAQEPK